MGSYARKVEGGCVSKWTDMDWWTGQTPEWKLRQRALQRGGETVASAGWKAFRWTAAGMLFFAAVFATYGAVLLLVPIYAWWKWRS